MEKNAQQQRMTLITAKAKEIRKKNESWSSAMKRATLKLKEEGKI
jgi:hypothetical protein